MGRRTVVRLLAAILAVSAGLVLPATALAHPLGNFTINHYAGLTIAVDRIELDLVIDMAEIPTFQERQSMDADGDGSVDDTEGGLWASTACTALATNLRLTRDAVPLPLPTGSATVTFPPGAGGLSTLRLECAFAAALAPAIDGRTEIGFSDASYPERIGWHEIVAVGSGTTVDTHGLPATSPTHRLTSYPADLISVPLDIRSATITVTPGPAASASTSVEPSVGPSASSGPGRGGAGPVAGATATPPDSPTGAVPGGVGADLPAIFRTADLTPFVILASLLTAVVIGAGHALTPGHGKTLMAAYLVGSRGSAAHAVGLGLSVAVSHTLGILALAFVIVGAGSVLPPDVVYRITPVIAGVSIVAIGGWMLANEVRRRRGSRLVSAATAPDHEHEHEDDHEDGPEPGHRREHDHQHEHEHGPEQEHPHEHPGEHSHGGVRHSHLPPAGATLSWRGLFVLGLAGGLIPSTSALLILLGSIAAGRPAFGLVLVVAFGLGMAAVMTAVGLAMIVARTRLDRLPSRSSLGRLAIVAPLAASVAVLVLGLVLTWQAVAGKPVL
jgi:ABC-type nickel/cobalt efflux system permease component RcnA